MTKHSQHHTDWGKTRSIPLENWHKTRMPSSTTPIQHSIGSSGKSNQARERNKRHPDRKRGSPTIPVCRKYDSVTRKLYSLYPKVPWSDKQLCQSFRMQSQCSKITGNPIHQEYPRQESNHIKLRQKSKS